MFLSDDTLPSLAACFVARSRSFAAGVAWGFEFGLTGTASRLDQTVIGTSLNQFESGAKIGIAEGVFQRLKAGRP